jgi:hypothetical protein
MLGVGGTVSDPTDPVLVCRDCGSESVWTRGTLRVPLDRPLRPAFFATELQWDDWYWCDQCDRRTRVTEADPWALQFRAELRAAAADLRRAAAEQEGTP